jgi:hypothetical protein
MMQKQVIFFKQVVDKLGDLAKQRGFTITARDDLNDSRGTAVDLENDQFIISAIRERDEENVWVHCKVRTRPRAHLRTYSIGDLAAFLQRKSDPYPLRSFSADAVDLIRYENQCLSVDLLNSEELRKWRVDASRRQFGVKKLKT